MEQFLKQLEQHGQWNSYEQAVEIFRQMYETTEFNEFPRNRNVFYIDALAFYSLDNWDKLPIHCKAFVINRYPIFLNMEAYGKTLNEYNEFKSELKQAFRDNNIPPLAILDKTIYELDNPFSNRGYFAFFANNECLTGISLNVCKNIANESGNGLIEFHLTYKLNEEFYNSIIVYNKLGVTSKLVDEKSLKTSQLIREIEPKPSDKEYDIVIDKDKCLICLDYGGSGLYSICKKAVPKSFVLENRCMNYVPSDTLLDHIKLKFLHDHNDRIDMVYDIKQQERNRIGNIINNNYDDNKDKFIENIQFLKTEDYPLYLYLYWIKFMDSVHTKDQAYAYAMEWIE